MIKAIFAELFMPRFFVLDDTKNLQMFGEVVGPGTSVVALTQKIIKFGIVYSCKSI